MRTTMLSLLVVMTACGGASATAVEQDYNPPASIVGTYALKTVGGAALPLIGYYNTTAGPTDLIGETITANADGSFIWTRTYRRYFNGVPDTYSVDSKGPYIYVGGVATFHQDVGGSGDYVLSAAGDKLTTTYPGPVWLYQRR